jgi:hypothetical protein
MKNKEVEVGNKFLALMLLNSLMRTKDKEFLQCVSDYFLDRLKYFAKENKDYKGLQEYSTKNISKSREAAKFYYLLG